MMICFIGAYVSGVPHDIKQNLKPPRYNTEHQISFFENNKVLISDSWRGDPFSHKVVSFPFVKKGIIHLKQRHNISKIPQKFLS